MRTHRVRKFLLDTGMWYDLLDLISNPLWNMKGKGGWSGASGVFACRIRYERIELKGENDMKAKQLPRDVESISNLEMGIDCLVWCWWFFIDISWGLSAIICFRVKRCHYSPSLSIRTTRTFRSGTTGPRSRFTVGLSTVRRNENSEKQETQLHKRRSSLPSRDCRLSPFWHRTTTDQNSKRDGAGSSQHSIDDRWLR